MGICLNLLLPGCIRVYCFVPSSNIDPPVLLQPPNRFLAGDTFYGRGALRFMGKLAGGQDLISPNVGKVDTVHIFRRFLSLWSFKPGFVKKTPSISHFSDLSKLETLLFDITWNFLSILANKKSNRRTLPFRTIALCCWRQERVSSLKGWTCWTGPGPSCLGGIGNNLGYNVVLRRSN